MADEASLQEGNLSAGARSSRERKSVDRLKSTSLVARTNKSREEASPAKKNLEDGKSGVSPPSAKKGRKPNKRPDQDQDDEGHDEESEVKEREESSKAGGSDKTSACLIRKKPQKKSDSKEEDPDLDTPLFLRNRKETTPVPSLTEKQQDGEPRTDEEDSDPLVGINLHAELTSMILEISKDALESITLRIVRR
jgi:hypothetical protein